MIINWTDTLLPNTTYQFNFGKAIVDLNEGNINSDLVYVFSTGDYIDSLSITGRLLSAADNQPVKESAILIYRGMADSLPTKSPPDYFTLTDDNGDFQLKYLPEGNFKIFALKEENSNYLYNGPPEMIAFLEERVSSSSNDSTGLILLRSFIEKDTSQYISSQKGTDYGYYEMIFNVPTKNPEVKFYDPETEEEIEAISLLNDTKDTLKSWVILPKYDNFEEAEIYISDDTTFADTAIWYFETNPKYKEKAELKITSNAARSKLDLEKTFALDFNNPLAEMDTTLISILEDSVQVYPTELRQGSLNRKLLVDYPFRADAKYIFRAEPGAFKDVFDTYSDSVVILFGLRDAEFYGSLTLAIAATEDNDPSEPKILQVLNSEGKILKEKTYSENLQITFPRMSPGKYKLKVIFDKNGNGKWDTGVYRKKIQPERQSFYTEEIEVRSNWEFEVEWTPTSPVD